MTQKLRPEEGPIALCGQYGFATPRGGVAKTADEAASLASDVGFPVALKIASSDVVHKTDVGGVELACLTEDEARRSYRRIIDRVRKNCPRARLEGVVVQEMFRGELELIIGLNNDEQFGPVIMFGLGGIFTELLNDVSFRVLPITVDDARSMVREIRGYRIIRGFRGRAPVSNDLVVDLLMKANAMGIDLGTRLGSVDLNPVSVSGRDHMVLDEKVSFSGKGDVITDREPNVSYLGGFFKAKTVALVGASGTPGKIGNAVLDSLARHQYRGKVFPVNPGQKEIQGLLAYPSLSAVPDPVDLVVVTVALKHAPSVLGECAQKGIHNMVVVSGGGKELGGDAAELEADIKHLGAEKDVRIVGCNCIGIFDGNSRLDTFFQTHERMTRPRKGPIAMITQSGTVGAAFLEAVEDVGVSKFVSYGNRIDVDEADLIAYLADDNDTRVIACYVEGFEDGRKFLRTARRVCQKKPIVVYKAGRSRHASEAALSHTGFFGGSYEVATGAFKQAGLIAVDSFEELCATTRALALQPRARGVRAAMVSNGAGTVVQCLDLANDYGLELASLASETVTSMRAEYPAYYQVGNPLDLTGSATSRDYEIGIVALSLDENVDIVMPWFVFQDTPLDEGILDVLEHLSQTSPKPIVCGATGGAYTRRMSQMICDRGVPVHHSVREWVVAARGLAY